MTTYNNITVSTSTLNTLKAIAARRGNTIEEMISEMCERGVKDYNYRSNRNKQNWQEQKEMKSKLARIEQKLAELDITEDDLELQINEQ
jgi:predicted DNA-binding ribbon-helix-helix protein